MAAVAASDVHVHRVDVFLASNLHMMTALSPSPFFIRHAMHTC